MRVGKNIKQPAGRNANTTTALDIACSLRANRRAAKAARREAPLYLHTCALLAQRPRAVFRRFLRTLGLVSSRGLRPAIALSREGLARVRVRPRRGRTRSASEVRLRGLPQGRPVSRLGDLPHAPQSQRLRGLLHVSAFSLTLRCRAQPG